MATLKKTEEDEIVREVFSIQPIIIGSFFTLLIISCLMLRYLSMLTCLWALLVGSGLAYVILINFPFVPSFWFFQKLRNKPKQISDNISMARCSVCQKFKCQRHRQEISEFDLEPWRNLKMNKAIDDAIEEFLDLLLENYVYYWYREKLSSDERLVDELRKSLRHIFSVVYRRLIKVDVTDLVIKKLVKNFLQHLDSYLKVRRKLRENSYTNSKDITLLLLRENGLNVHKALYSKWNERQYQRQLLHSLLPHVLPRSALQSRSACGLFGELLVYGVFTTGIDVIVQPDFVNQLLLILLDKKSMEEPLEPKTDEVEVLAKFAKSRGKTPFNALQCTMPQIINNPPVLFHFIKFMKDQGSLKVLQFCLSLDDFNKRILVPNLTHQDKEKLIEEANTLYGKYFVKGSPDFIEFDEDIVASLRKVLESSFDQLTPLEMATPLYRAYEHVFDLLEHIYLPLFHQSDQYFFMICGKRVISHLQNRRKEILKEKRQMVGNCLPLYFLRKVMSNVIILFHLSS
ncbi:sorting nexin-14-like isoform X2 [Xenia sp. Carnegie-2017]|uniref:sorting nexin-14-like isoform X2 n=1 Tax=Xenia sp. Carnegie-2017 TaxID=2897299 RepID=UPI001F0467B3|nr:sorting nexin-14-like isoform X2 [Xenia sp. Carnegie-2017]